MNQPFEIGNADAVFDFVMLIYKHPWFIWYEYESSGSGTVIDLIEYSDYMTNDNDMIWLIWKLIMNNDTWECHVLFMNVTPMPMLQCRITAVNFIT